MTNNAFPANAEGMPTRRTFLRGSALALVAGAVPATAAAITVSILPDLIRQHHDAEEAYIVASDALEAAEKRFSKTLSPLAPLSMMPDGKRPSGGLEFRLFGATHIEQEILKTHTALRERHCGKYVLAMAPAVHEQLLAALDASQAACLRELQSAAGMEGALREQCGVAECTRLLDEADTALVASRLAILGSVPVSKADRQMKADWLRALLRRGFYVLEGDEVDALASSIVGEA